MPDIHECRIGNTIKADYLSPDSALSPVATYFVTFFVFFFSFFHFALHLRRKAWPWGCFLLYHAFCVTKEHAKNHQTLLINCNLIVCSLSVACK